MHDDHEVRVRYAESLAEVYQQVQEIAVGIGGGEQEERPLFWFRGHSRAEYNLLPNILRQGEDYYNAARTYSDNHLREEYRFQNFMARNFDNLNYRMPQSVIEWQEVMQHYFAKTRLMDWSESLTVALEFAVEDFIKPIKDLEVQERCRLADPVVWILRPDKLNREVYDSFAKGNEEIIYRALRLYRGNKRLARKIHNELASKENRGIYFELKKKEEKNMDAMISLSALEMLRDTYSGRELKALEYFEMNPFFFLLLRYYSDGLPVEYGALPPLAIIHPYHSERIRAQMGVFTIFPHYLPTPQMEKMKEHLGKSPVAAMEYMSQCIPYLYKIQLVNPKRVAADLLMTGARRSKLYPDIQMISQDMENVVK